MTTLAEFTIIKKLGDGAYSSVFKVKRQGDEEVYALKKVKMLNLSDKEKENALNEVRNTHGWDTYIPKFAYCTDNAAMIAMVGALMYRQGDQTPFSATAKARLKL